MSLHTVGVFATSQKEQEKRVPIHPGQLTWVDEEVRRHLVFENGYGRSFGVSDDAIASLSGGVASREALFEQCDIYLLAKPVYDDFALMRPGATHWGWPHCVQQRDVTQAAIDRKLTLIAWEAMHRWGKRGDWQMHIFHKNNEIAGYAGVMHAMSLAGIDGNFGPKRKAVVFSFGSVSRGAVRALRARGIHDIVVLTQRHYVLVADQMPGVDYFNFGEDEDGHLVSLHPDQRSRPILDELADADIIVNGILQDTDRPLVFVAQGEEERLKKGCLIVDVSCDEGMGFHFARPTSFSAPMFDVGPVRYYAVDHTPSYLWDSASWEISKSLLPYLPIVMGGPERWDQSETIRKAIEIQNGVIKNPKILSFQQRTATYPHPPAAKS